MLISAWVYSLKRTLPRFLAHTQLVKALLFRHFLSRGLSLKIEPINDGHVGGPEGSPWSKFKQSAVQGMYVCACVHKRV